MEKLESDLIFMKKWNLKVVLYLRMERVYEGFFKTLKSSSHIIFHIFNSIFVRGLSIELIWDEKDKVLYWWLELSNIQNNQIV